jgi:hypothetical protein
MQDIKINNDIENAKQIADQINDNDYFDCICEQYDDCVFYDEFSNDVEGFVIRCSNK